MFSWTVAFSLFTLGFIHSLEHSYPVIFAYCLEKQKLSKTLPQILLFTAAAAAPWILIAALCSALGSVFYQPAWERYFDLVLGITLLAIGGSLIFHCRLPHLHLGYKGDSPKIFFWCRSKEKCHSHHPRSLSTKQLFTYGLLIGFGPCPPVLLLYAFAAESHKILYGVLGGIIFSIATLISLLVLAGITIFFQKIFLPRASQKIGHYYSFASGIILAGFGIYLIVSKLI